MSTENQHKEELFSRAVKAGKRTYFFDVKETKAGEQYLTLTESKRRFDNNQGKFVYEKHKLFLFQEDFDKFLEGFNQAVGFINGEEIPLEEDVEEEDAQGEEVLKKMSNIDFDDLDS